MDRARRRRQLQLSASRHDRRRRAGAAGERSGAHERVASRRPRVVAAPGQGLPDRAAGPHRGRRRAVRGGKLQHDPPRHEAFVGRLDRRPALDFERFQALLQRLRRPPGACVRLRRPHPRVRGPRRRRAQVEGRALRKRPARAAAGPGPVDRAVGGGRAGSRRGDERRVPRARAVPRDRGQDVEPSRPRRRHIAGPQRQEMAAFRLALAD